QHQMGNESCNLTAKRLLLSALGSEKPSIQNVNTVDITQIRELVDKAVNEKLATFTNVDSVDSIKKHEVDHRISDRIKVGLEDGGEINSFVYTHVNNVNNQINQVYGELQEIASKIDSISEKCSSNSQSPVTSHQSPVTSHQSPVTSHQSPVTNHQLELIELLGLGAIVIGEIYYQQLLIDSGIDGRIIANKGKLEAVGIKFGRQKTPVARLNHILTSLGFSAKNIGQKSIRGKSGIECYQVRI
ncbi:MAG: hypothetical protein ACKO3K_04375, partial [Cuspidothrix sp.]